MQNKEEQLIADGDAAEVLLGNDTFNTTVNKLVEQTFQTFVNTKTDDQSGREAAYYSYRALVDIVHTLQQRVAVRDEIINRDTNEEE